MFVEAGLPLLKQAERSSWSGASVSPDQLKAAWVEPGLSRPAKI